MAERVLRRMDLSQVSCGWQQWLDAVRWSKEEEVRAGLSAQLAEQLDLVAAQQDSMQEAQRRSMGKLAAQQAAMAAGAAHHQWSLNDAKQAAVRSELVMKQQLAFQQIARVLLRMSRATMLAGFNGWLAAVASAKAQEVAVQRMVWIVRRLQQGKLSAAWGSWCGVVQEEQEAEAKVQRATQMAERVLRRMDLSQLSLGWLQWVDVVRWGQQEDATAAAAAAHREAMHRLRDSTSATQRASALRVMQLVCQRMERASLLAGFNGWVGFVLSAKAHAAALQRMGMIVRRLQRAGLAAAWGSWVTMVQEQERMRKATRSAERVLRRMDMGVCGRAWSQWVDVVRWDRQEAAAAHV